MLGERPVLLQVDKESVKDAGAFTSPSLAGLLTCMGFRLQQWVG